MEKILFTPEGEEPVEFYVLEQTRIGGKNYILVTDAEDGDGEAWIMKDLSEDGEAESRYVFVEEDDELDAVAGVFSNMLEDEEIRQIMERERDPAEKAVKLVETANENGGRDNITVVVLNEVNEVTDEVG